MKDGADMDKAIGVRIRERRTALKLSQEQLGKAIGVRFQQIGKYERGENRLSVSQLGEIARALRCKYSELLDGIVG